VKVWGQGDVALEAAVRNVAGDDARDLAAAIRLKSVEWFSELVQGGAQPGLVLAAALQAPTAEFLQEAFRSGISRKEGLRSLLKWEGLVPRTKNEKKRAEALLKVVLSVQAEDQADSEVNELEADAMGWAVKVASSEVVELLLDREVDPNARFEPPESAMEEAVRNSFDPEDARKLVKVLLRRGVEYDEDEVRRITTRKRRAEWLNRED
jgi:hypothetical protein